jgi:UDP-N-acetylmuramate dehydrogenase
MMEDPILQSSNTPITGTMFAAMKETEDSGLVGELKLIPGLKIKISEPLARHTSMKIGGPADFFLDVETAAGLTQAVKTLRRRSSDFFLLGNGSNVLISDRGVRGAVIRLTGEFKRAEWRQEGEIARVQVGAAFAVTQLAREAARKGYAGLEFAEGIPGTIGGALYMNAGAYGSEFEKVVDEIEGITGEGDNILLTRDQVTFTYRDAHLPTGMIVTRARLRLEVEDAAGVSARLRELVARRKASQPSGHPNSGSMFRNPPGDFAGRLIEAAGLKGKKMGQAQISERHGNFIVNLGGAQAEDVRRLMELARAEVRNQFGVDLEPEVRLMGEWPIA